MNRILAYLYRRKVGKLKQRIAGLRAVIEHNLKVENRKILTAYGEQDLVDKIQTRAELQEQLNQLIG